MKLNVKYSITTTGDQYLSYGFKAEVTEAEGISPCIFVYHAGTPELPTRKVVDNFSHVASPTDMEETPEGEPDMGNKNPYYRRSSVTLWVRSADWLDEIKKHIDHDIAQLMDNLNMLNDQNQYVNEEVKTYG